MWNGKIQRCDSEENVLFPIIPRLQRLYASKEFASQMRWNFEKTNNPNVLCHPSDGKLWKHFDEVYPNYAKKCKIGFMY